MKNYILMIIMFLGMNISAQTFSTIMNTQLAHNPSRVSIFDASLHSSMTNQLLGVENAPRSWQILAGYGIKGNTHIAINLKGESMGIYQRNLFGASYAYTVGKSWQLQMGLSLFYEKTQQNFSQIIWVNQDPTLPFQDKSLNGIAGEAGFMLTNHNFFVGVAGFYSLNTDLIAEKQKRFFCDLGYRFDFGVLEIEPSISTEFTNISDEIASGNLTLQFFKKIFVTGNYNTIRITTGIGYQDNRIGFSYMHGIPNKKSLLSSNTITFSYSFGKKEKKSFQPPYEKEK